MKKPIAILLAIVMCISLCSCGITLEPSLDEKLQDATELDWAVIGKEVSENTARAKANYEGKCFIYTGTVKEISENFCVLTDENGSGTTNVYLANEELIQLNVGDTITVLGNLMDINYKQLKFASLVHPS